MSRSLCLSFGEKNQNNYPQHIYWQKCYLHFFKLNNSKKSILLLGFHHVYLFFYKMCTFSLHKHTTADFRCTCTVLLLSYTGDSRAAFNMPLTSHLYTRIDTWFFFFLQKNACNFLLSSLIPCRVFCSTVTMKIGLSLITFHLFPSMGINSVDSMS